MTVRASDYYAVSEENDQIEPFREYRGEVALANSEFAFAIGGDIVSADEYGQGPQGVTGEGAVGYVAEQFIPRVYEPTKPRVIDDLLDPYNSPMLEGFVQSGFEPEEVIGYIDEKGKTYKTKPGRKQLVEA